jgi:hypothetical protein
MSYRRFSVLACLHQAAVLSTVVGILPAALSTVVGLLLSMAVGRTADAASPAACDVLLSVELTPDVPNPRDEGFLSSLLNNHPGYQLTLQRQDNSSVIVLDLTGPGPEYRCQNVVETMRRDARVLSIDLQAQPT